MFPIPGAQQLFINSKQVENISPFKNLRSVLLPNEQAKGEATARTDNARRAFLQLRLVLGRCSEIRLQSKVLIFCSEFRCVHLWIRNLIIAS